MPDGFFVYLASGKVIAFPTATFISLYEGGLRVVEGREELISIPLGSVWAVSKRETPPVPA